MTKLLRTSPPSPVTRRVLTPMPQGPGRVLQTGRSPAQLSLFLRPAAAR